MKFTKFTIYRLKIMKFSIYKAKSPKCNSFVDNSHMPPVIKDRLAKKLREVMKFSPISQKSD